MYNFNWNFWNLANASSPSPPPLPAMQILCRLDGSPLPSHTQGGEGGDPLQFFSSPSPARPPPENYPPRFIGLIFFHRPAKQTMKKLGGGGGGSFKKILPGWTKQEKFCSYSERGNGSLPLSSAQFWPAPGWVMGGGPIFQKKKLDLTWRNSTQFKKWGSEYSELELRNIRTY